MKTPPIRILLVDDDEDDYLIIKALLQETVKPVPRLEWIATFELARQTIETAAHDVYLIDYHLGEESGLDLLKCFDLIQRRQPFIILTGAGDETVEKKAMQIGAADYLVKGAFGSDLLNRVIQYSLQRKLMEAQRIQHLVDINRSKDEFIALTSHQLRTPATAVKQYIGMLMEGYAGPITPKQADFLKHAYSSNERQLKVINAILQVAQLDLQKIHLHMIRCDINSILEECLKELMPLIQDRSQELKFQKPETALYIHGDPAHLTMAIDNILNNASKYTMPGKKVQVTLSESPNKRISIAITDQGVGIKKPDLEKLFKKFSRIDNPLSVEVGGTGLGLYWSQEIIRQHHGAIRVESKISVGTTFTLSFPMMAPST